MILLDQETFRKSQWEHLKHFRSKYDPEFSLTDSIKSSADVNKTKKEMDKLVLNSIRLAVVEEQTAKVFEYLEML